MLDLLHEKDPQVCSSSSQLHVTLLAGVFYYYLLLSYTEFALTATSDGSSRNVRLPSGSFLMMMWPLKPEETEATAPVLPIPASPPGSCSCTNWIGRLSIVPLPSVYDVVDDKY